jgi:hypothetical protein
MIRRDQIDPVERHADVNPDRGTDGSGTTPPRLDRRHLSASIAGGMLVGGLVISGQDRVAEASHNGGLSDRDWKYCQKCRALHLPKRRNRTGKCSAGGSHAVYANYDYLATHYFIGSDPNHQVGWRLCTKCRVFHLATSYGFGKCAEGGTHAAPSTSVIYLVSMGVPSSPGQLENGWRQCDKCRVLHWAGDGTFGPCPAGGTHNNGNGTDYLIHLDT